MGDIDGITHGIYGLVSIDDKKMEGIVALSDCHGTYLVNVNQGASALSGGGSNTSFAAVRV